jgi:hypothetical protein
MKNRILLLTIVLLGGFGGICGSNKKTNYISPLFLAGTNLDPKKPTTIQSTPSNLTLPGSISLATDALNLPTPPASPISAPAPEVPSMIISLPTDHGSSALKDFSDFAKIDSKALNKMSHDQKRVLDQKIHALSNLAILEYILNQTDMDYEQLAEMILADKLTILDRTLLNLSFTEYQNLVKEYDRSSADSAKLNQLIDQIQKAKPGVNLVVLEYLLTKFGGDQSTWTINDLTSKTVEDKQNRLAKAFDETKTGNLR